MPPEVPDFWDDLTIRSASRSAAEDPEAMAARRVLCNSLVKAFDPVGTALRCMGNMIGPGRVDSTSPFGNGDDGLVALGYLCETAASLISGAMQLLEQDNCYAAASLNRQLVEVVEYLAWAFGEDHEEAASWLRSSRDDRLSRWQPRHLRERSQGRFRGADYSEHCELGGHPTPQGARALIGNGNQPRTREFILRESVVFGLSTWHYVEVAEKVLCGHRGLDDHSFITIEVQAAIAQQEEDWSKVDRVSAVWRIAQSRMT